MAAYTAQKMTFSIKFEVFHENFVFCNDITAGLFLSSIIKYAK